jgi:hypothetical protein
VIIVPPRVSQLARLAPRQLLQIGGQGRGWRKRSSFAEYRQDPDIALERGSNLETDEIVGIVETTFAVVRG